MIGTIRACRLLPTAPTTRRRVPLVHDLLQLLTYQMLQTLAV